MSHNAPQCPTFDDHHDTPSPLHPTAAASAAPPQESLAPSHLLPDDAPSDNPQSASVGRAHPDIANPQLTTPQLTAIDLLVLGHKDTAVAAALGIDRKTLYRWRHQDPRFREELDRRRKDLLDNTADRFRTLLTDALDTFARHLKDPYAPTAHRAARALLALAAIGRQTPTAPGEPASAGGSPKTPP